MGRLVVSNGWSVVVVVVCLVVVLFTCALMVAATASLMLPWHGSINKHWSNRQQATIDANFDEQQHFLLGDIVCVFVYGLGSVLNSLCYRDRETLCRV